MKETFERVSSISERKIFFGQMTNVAHFSSRNQNNNKKRRKI